MKKGLKIFLILLFILAVSAAFIYMYQTSSKENSKFETVKVEVRDISTKAVATGAVKPREVIEIKPNISGVIAEIHVKEGQTRSEERRVGKECRSKVGRKDCNNKRES